MRHIDASSIVHAWDTYPPDVFPRLWTWIQEQIESGEIEFAQPAMDEVQHVAPDCALWLASISASICAVSNPAVQRANWLKSSLAIENDKYDPKGVDENDLLIIACAYCKGVALVSNEAKQPSLPVNLKRYKIPAVCTLSGQTCTDFLTYMKSAGRTFG